MVYIDDIRYPNEVVVEASTDDATPATDNDNDFFSSWDKPSIKRPTPPPSRTATPPVLGRTPSPFNPLNSGSNGNGISRTKSPLVNSTPAAPRTTSSAALRTKGGTAATRKGGVLGAKKGAKLGAKKIGTSEAIDFDEAEKKAKEEAERIAKLGYDPDAEAETEKKKDSAKSSVVSPTPISAASPKGHQRNSSDAERLGLQMNRLGFGQVAGAQVAKAAPKKMGGFGSTGSSSAADGMNVTPGVSTIFADTISRGR
jgi:ADP-ribosylation factor GTPase-activating protein 2/3